METFNFTEGKETLHGFLLGVSELLPSIFLHTAQFFDSDTMSYSEKSHFLPCAVST